MCVCVYVCVGVCVCVCVSLHVCECVHAYIVHTHMLYLDIHIFLREKLSLKSLHIKKKLRLYTQEKNVY